MRLRFPGVMILPGVFRAFTEEEKAKIREHARTLGLWREAKKHINEYWFSRR